MFQLRFSPSSEVSPYAFGSLPFPSSSHIVVELLPLPLGTTPIGPWDRLHQLLELSPLALGSVVEVDTGIEEMSPALANICQCA